MHYPFCITQFVYDTNLQRVVNRYFQAAWPLLLKGFNRGAVQSLRACGLFLAEHCCPLVLSAGLL